MNYKEDTGNKEHLKQLLEQVSRSERETKKNLKILLEITKFVSSYRNLQDVLDAIVDLLTGEFKLDACSIRLIDSDGILRIKSQKGLSKKFVEAATRKPTVDSYSGDCFLTRKIVIVRDIKKIDKPISTTLLVGEDIKSFAVAPIEVEEEPIGVLVFASKRRAYFHERFNDVIYIISNQIGTAIKISQLHEEIFNFSKVLEKKIKERTKTLKEKNRQLIETEKLAVIGKLANRVADDCRNSLTVAGGFARRLYEKAPDDDIDKKYLGLIVEEIMKLEEKISRILKIEY